MVISSAGDTLVSGPRQDDQDRLPTGPPTGMT